MSEHNELALRALDAERDRCRVIVTLEYAYWRKVMENGEDKTIIDFATGACGAAANILARIEGLVTEGDRVVTTDKGAR